MQCFRFCPMLNQFGVCESAMRRPEYITECPHRKMVKDMKKYGFNQRTKPHKNR